MDSKEGRKEGRMKKNMKEGGREGQRRAQKQEANRPWGSPPRSCSFLAFCIGEAPAVPMPSLLGVLRAEAVRAEDMQYNTLMREGPRKCKRGLSRE